MTAISEWMLEVIREESEKLAYMSGWLELDRHNWVFLVSRIISFILDGGSLLVCTDGHREWFGKYILKKLNYSSCGRPLVPVYELDKSILGVLERKGSEKQVYDLLNMSYNEYAFWYIGKTDSNIARLALNKDNGFFWVLDESFEFAFTLDSNDPTLDFKLLQLYLIFERALFSSIYGDFDINE